MSLQGFLTRLIWLCVLPPILLAAYLAVHQVQSLQAVRDLEAANLSKNLAVAIDQDLSARIAALRMLAASPNANDAARMKAFYLEAQAFAQNYGSHVVLGDTQKRMLFNTRMPFGTTLPTLPEIKGRNAALIALETGNPAIGDIFVGPVVKKPLVGAAVPIMRDGRNHAVVVATVETGLFQNRLDQVALPFGWSLTLFDGQGRVIARKPPPGPISANDVDPAGRFVVNLTSAPWSVVLEIPRNIYQAPLVSAAFSLALVILGATLVGAFGGMLASRRLGRWVTSLALPHPPGTAAPYIKEIADVRDVIDRSLADREAAEKAKRASDRRFSATFDQAAVGIALVAPDGRWLQANEKLCKIIGYRRDELLGTTFQEITHPDDLDTDLTYVRKMLSGEIHSYSIEKRYIHRDGNVVWVNLTVALTRQADGSPDYFISVVEDIQRRKETEQGLRNSESALRDAQRLAGIGNWRWDLRTNQHTWSEEIYRIHGRDRSLPPAVLPEMQTYFTADSWARLTRAIDTCLTSGASYACDVEIVPDTGTNRWVTVRGEGLLDTDGQVLELHGTIQDITERKLASEELMVSHIALKSILQGVFITTPDMRIVSANAAFLSITGYSLAEILGRTCRLIQGPLTDQSTVERIHVAIENSADFSGDILNYRKDGSTFWNELSISPVVNEQGRLINFIGTISDITERKIAAAELHTHRNQLEELVRSRTGELATARDAAEAANAAKSRFMAAASHDLRQPLVALSLYVGVLNKRVSSDNVELVSNIQDCVDSLSELLTDLLDVSKLDAGVVAPKATDFSIDDLLTSLVSVHSIEARLKGLRLHWRRSGASAQTDQTLFGRILGNLLANAIRFTEKGGVLIACRQHQGKRWVEIWDTGIGIAENKTDIVFDEYRQLGDNSRGRGSGLGLAIVAKTAQLLGLQIRLRSRPGRGSMFAVEFPPGRTPPPVDAPLVPPLPRTFRIGLVEDNAEVLRALVLALENQGHEVLAATSAQGLIERLNNQKPDIVISDYRLSTEETGFDVIARMKDVFGADLPALLITGDTDPALVRSMADRGIAVHYKPLRISALQAIISQATERSSS